MNAQLNAMTNTGLVAMFNSLSDKTMKAWKGKKSVLVARIEALQAKVVTKKEEKQKTVKDPTDTIGGFTCGLLAKVLHYIGDNGNTVPKGTANAQPVGASYATILDAVQKRFPKCKTNYNCLRCYAGRMRERGEFVPVHREPSKWTVKKAVKK